MQALEGCPWITPRGAEETTKDDVAGAQPAEVCDCWDANYPDAERTVPYGDGWSSQ